MQNPDYLSVAKHIFTARFPDAACGFVAGSIVTGHGTPSSDIDLIVLYDDNDHETYRESIMAEGWPVEIFVHNLKSQDYFFNEDIENGASSTLTMVTTGILIGLDTKLGFARKEQAEALLAQGPEPLTSEVIDWKRYAITDLLEDLRYPKDCDYRYGILADLFTLLGNFYLRAQGKWSGSGKQLVKILKQDDPVFAARFLSSFNFNNPNFAAIEQLVNDILAPYGGQLFTGYKSIALPERWQK